MSDRLTLIKEIYSKLASLEKLKAQANAAGVPSSYIDAKMNKLRIKLADLMNNVCPVIRRKQ